jgi:hypothetical protein
VRRYTQADQFGLARSQRFDFGVKFLKVAFDKFRVGAKRLLKNRSAQTNVAQCPHALPGGIAGITETSDAGASRLAGTPRSRDVQIIR